MGHRSYSILTVAQLERLPTPRLLKLKNRLRKINFIGYDDYICTCGCAECTPIMEKQSEVWDQIDLIKKICSTREHVVK